MPFDGVLGDLFDQGRRIRSTTLPYALQTYPLWILELCLNQVSVDITPCVSGAQIARLQSQVDVNRRIILTMDDWILCKKIAVDASPLYLFASDTQSVAIEKIKAHIKVEFSNRSHI